MGLYFKDDLLEEFGTWALAYAPYGGADVGEIAAIGKTVGAGDAGAFYDAWVAAGDRRVSKANDAKKAGHLTTARELFLRASAFYAGAFHPFYGSPVDARLLRAFEKQVAASDAGLALLDPPVLPAGIPFAGATMPAYFIPAAGAARSRRSTIIFTNGFDGTITDMYFASAVAASRRGYHALLFDGPGQGAMLYQQDVPMRPDWETVVSAVVDFALTLPEVDPDRLILSGWSLGGFLAPRAASGEHRLAACIADPGQWAIGDSFRPLAAHLGASPEVVANLGLADDNIVRVLEGMIAKSPKMHWGIVQRGFWVFGVSSVRDFLVKAEQFTMSGRAGLIRCPTLITAAESDPLAAGAKTLFEALRCPKAFVPFHAVDGAQDHCEMGNRTLLNQTALDWLDETLGRPGGS